MQKEWIDLVAAVAWPLVGLIAILILGPGGLLRDIVKNLSSVATSIEELKVQVNQLREAEDRISRSTQQVSDLRTQLGGMELQISSIKSLAGDLVSQSLSAGQRDGGDAAAGGHEAKIEGVNRTAGELFGLINQRWNQLCEVFRDKLEDFDARSIGDAAWKLTDKRRKNPITKQEAEHIDALFGTMKRFRRLQGSMDDWLNADVYESFASGVDEAIAVLQR